MLPMTAWKSGLAISAFLAVPAAIFLSKHAPVPDSAFTAWQESDVNEAQYAKPSPFTVPPTKARGHVKDLSKPAK
jgi:hypothetical protein